MEQWELNKKLCTRGYRLMVLSFVLVFSCLISPWFAAPTLIIGAIGCLMVLTGIKRESTRQIKELLDEFAKQQNTTNGI